MLEHEDDVLSESDVVFDNVDKDIDNRDNLLRLEGFLVNLLNLRRGSTLASVFRKH